MKIGQVTIALAIAALTATLGAVEVQPAAPIAASNVVLVHGAWADGSSWAEVIPLLQVLYAVQEPAATALFGGRTTAAAWHSKPSWYAVSKLDQTINPDLERILAKRMNATTVELEAGHLSLVSHPKEIADLILAAAGRKE